MIIVELFKNYLCLKNNLKDIPHVHTHVSEEHDSYGNANNIWMGGKK